MLLRIVLELVAHSLELIGITCRVCNILRQVLILHPSISARLATAGFPFVSLSFSLGDLFESLSQELLTDVTQLVCILLWVDLNIL